jgi:hypothetical protein
LIGPTLPFPFSSSFHVFPFLKRSWTLVALQQQTDLLTCLSFVAILYSVLLVSAVFVAGSSE